MAGINAERCGRERRKFSGKAREKENRKGMENFWSVRKMRRRGEGLGTQGGSKTTSMVEVSENCMKGEANLCRDGGKGYSGRGFGSWVWISVYSSSHVF